MNKKMYKSNIINENFKIKKAILLLNKLPNKFCIIVDNNNCFLGTLTDGDIRRGLLKNYTIEDKISKFYNSSSFTLKKKCPYSEIEYLMNLKKLNFIPQINKLNKIVNIHVKNYAKEIKKLPNIMLIMAGGKGKRLRPLTKNIPKPLLPVNGRPIIEKIILLAKKQGISKFIVSINYLGKMIKNYLGDGKKLGVKIEYLEEKKPLGTAGSLFLLKNIDTPFVVSNADIISNIDYSSMIQYHKKFKSFVTIGSINMSDKNLYGTIIFKNKKVLRIEEKKENRYFINAGIYILDPSVKNFIKGNEYHDMTDLIEKLISKKKNVNLFPIHEKWFDYGVKSSH